MKRYKGSYEELISLEKLYLAYISASKAKKNKRKVLRFALKLGTNLKKLYKELKSLEYKPLKAHCFYVKEKKLRLIQAPAFKDTVIQHLLYNALYEYFAKSFIVSNTGCVKGRGTLQAKTLLQSYVNEASKDKARGYYLQMDIKKYFYNIDKNTLEALLKRKIKDERITRLLLIFCEGQKGLNLGNLISQLLAVLYLSVLDDYAKRELKARFYLRYMDDFIFLGLAKKQARAWLLNVRSFLKKSLKLELSRYTLQRLERGVSFVGFRVFKGFALLRKEHIIHYTRALKSGYKERCQSIEAMAKHTKSAAYLQACKLANAA